MKQNVEEKRKSIKGSQFIDIFRITLFSNSGFYIIFLFVGTRF